MKYLVLDTESGSRHANSTLLTASFIVFDTDFNFQKKLNMFLKPEEGEHYIVDAQGMAVNKINLVEHHKLAVTNKQAKPYLFEFLKEHGSNERLVPVGHAVKGDIERIVNNLISRGSWEQFCTYHFIDTSVVLQFLRICGLMPMDCDGSIEALAAHFNIEHHGPLHVSETDALITMEVLKAFADLVKYNNIPEKELPLMGHLATPGPIDLNKL
jgi:hypothetical protein